MADPTKIDLSYIAVYIRWFLSCFVLEFIAIILSGQLLTQIPAFRISSTKGRHTIRFYTVIVNVTAYGDEVIVGISGFIVVLLTMGLLLGRQIPALLTERFGIDLGHFEALCVFSSFVLMFVSFVLKVFYAVTYVNAVDTPESYEQSIDRLAQSPGDDINAE